MTIFYRITVSLQTLGVLINLVEHCAPNRAHIYEAVVETTPSSDETTPSEGPKTVWRAVLEVCVGL